MTFLSRPMRAIRATSQYDSQSKASYLISSDNCVFVDVHILGYIRLGHFWRAKCHNFTIIDPNVMIDGGNCLQFIIATRDTRWYRPCRLGSRATCAFVYFWSRTRTNRWHFESLVSRHGLDIQWSFSIYINIYSLSPPASCKKEKMVFTSFLFGPNTWIKSWPKERNT